MSRQTRISVDSSDSGPIRIPTRLTELLHIELPIICGPMFMVSDVDLVVAACETGILGVLPALNYRSPAELRDAIEAIQERTDRPFAVDLMVNRSNSMLDWQLETCVSEQVPIYITSLGNPKWVIQAAHGYNAKVLCEVTNLNHARRAAALGVDAIIAIGSGAGGHTGEVSSMVLLPRLTQHVSVPIVCAGGIADGRGLAAALALGGDGVRLTTRFIASNECKAAKAYKKAIVDANPKDLIITDRISGYPTSVIRTPFTERIRQHQSRIERWLINNRYTKRLAQTVWTARAYVLFGGSAREATSKAAWCAGQSVGLIDSEQPVARIVDHIVSTYSAAIRNFPQLERPLSAVLH